jgi:type IV pilus assembly protein PilC
MPYRYIAFDSAGNEQTGILDVEQEETAENILIDRGLIVARLTPARRGIDLARWFPTFFGAKKRDVIVFTNQLANLLESGVAILPALQLMSEESTSTALRKVLREVVEDIRQGSSIADALAKHELVFSELYVSMIEVGEQTGNLDEILRQLAKHMEKEETLKANLRSAMTYPAIVLLLAIGVVLLMLNFTLPPLLGLYNEFDAQLPLPTRILMAASAFFLEYRLVIFAVLIVIILGAYLYFRTPRGRQQLHYWFLKLPVIGRINTQGNVSRFSRTLATLLQAGLRLPESMRLTEETIQNVILSEEIEELRQETLQGRGIAAPLAGSEHFPQMLAQVVRIGEETGTLDEHLLTLADFYEEEVDRALDNLTSLLEPGMVIFVGVIVAFVAISVIMPMYSLLGQIR